MNCLEQIEYSTFSSFILEIKWILKFPKSVKTMLLTDCVEEIIP